ncbi:hypothetical protein HOY80DRAFT_1015021 [Tuber brumale]|nr:hypothetical protein HOY80DRAFT_1015021 [Tuber brumale]
MYHPETSTPHRHKRKKLILCFDVTGNKFKRNDGDTNILKIFRMLDREGSDQSLDAAVDTSFGQHVIGGYKFLMRFYAPGDDIYLFGFSRGAYTARFLAEMLDHVGLVSQGNEGNVIFVRKTFSNWEQRKEGVGWGALKQDMYNYMRAFRETFARPVRRVQFLGLFDTVNSVPRFENAWLKRSAGFPYTARSTARVIRHAVGIDERRAKFRQDLVEKVDVQELARRRSFKAGHLIEIITTASPTKTAIRPRLARSYNDSRGGREELNIISDGGEGASFMSLNIHVGSDSDDTGEKAEQDIGEVWFPGAHGDIGGGWDLPDGEESLSHGPLVWMVREARKAGVVFDKGRMKQMNVWLDDSHSPSRTPAADATPAQAVDPKTYLLNSYTSGKIHDCLCYPSGGLSLAGTLGWKLMEYLPFRRMDLQPDSSWKPIIWPLPCGEVRDIPDTVKIHNSVVRRMKADPKYRPGNLIIGGGGRGVRRAPKNAGIGEWEVLREGSLVGEVLVKKGVVEKELVGGS